MEYTSVRLIDGKLQEQTWLDGAWGSIIGAINAFIAGHSLDELFIAPKTNNHVNANHLNNETPENIEQIFSQRISEQVITMYAKNSAQWHSCIECTQITKLEVPKEILELRTRYWESDALNLSPA